MKEKHSLGATCFMTAVSWRSQRLLRGWGCGRVHKEGKNTPDRGKVAQGSRDVGWRQDEEWREALCGSIWKTRYQVHLRCGWSAEAASHSTALNWGGDLGFYSKARGNHLRFGAQQHLIDCISNRSRGVGGKRLCRENSWEPKRVSQEKYCLSLASTGNRLTDKVSGSESVFGENTHQEVEGRQLWDYYWVDYCCGQLGSEENTLSPQHCLAEGGQRLGCLSIDAYLSSTECCPGSIEPLTLLSWLIPCLWRSLSTKENPQGEGDTGHWATDEFRNGLRINGIGHRQLLPQITFQFHQKVDTSRKIDVISKFCV